MYKSERVNLKGAIDPSDTLDMRVYYHDPNSKVLVINSSTGLAFKHMEINWTRYCHDRLPEQALTYKRTKYDSLISTLQNNGWKTNPLITIIVGVRGAIHKNSKDQLIKLIVLKISIKIIMKNIRQNAVKYLTYLIMNKTKFDNKQSPIPHH